MTPLGLTERHMDDVDVLVVDDDPDACESMAVLLGAFGYHARIARDARSALGELDRHAAPCVVLDLGMPGMNGIELARTIRARHGDGMVLIALTGWTDAERQCEAEAAGVDFVLVKPLDMERFRRLLPPVPAPLPEGSLARS
jgi:DNA-binding response OmpR family regulator